MTNPPSVLMPKTEAGNDPADYKDDPRASKELKELVAVAVEKERQKRKVSSGHRFAANVVTLDADFVNQKPEPREMLCGRFPVSATSAVVAMGGVGKTTWLVRKAMDYASEGGQVLFVSAEDSEHDYQAKIHNALFSKREGKPYQDIEPDDVIDRLHVLNFRGAGIKLVAEMGGSFVPSAESVELAHFIKADYPKVRLVIFETVSRFAGGEDNERMEAVVTACDHIAATLNGACVLVHHTGKSQARDKVIDLYSGRGGSALGDNTRSMVVMTRIDDDYSGAEPIVASRDDIEAGKVFEVFHVRNSYGPTSQPEYYITRSGYRYGPVLEPIPIATQDDITQRKLDSIRAKNNQAANSVHDVIKAEGGTVGRKYFEKNTKDLIGLTQTQGRELLTEMIDAGSLKVEERSKSSGQKEKVLRISSQNKGVSV